MKLDDPRWETLRGGYHVPYDPRGALARLSATSHDDGAWDELWQELYHQGDVGEASYATVIQVTKLRQAHGPCGWEPYGFALSIELARTEEQNPPLPEWLEPEYQAALAELVVAGIAELPSASDDTVIRNILGLVALSKGLRTYAHLLCDFTADEIDEVLERL